MGQKWRMIVTSYSLTERKAFRVLMPYCLTPTDSGFMLLNRNYKPLGVVSKTRVDYEDFPAQIVKFTIHPRRMKGVWSYHGIQGKGENWSTDNPAPNGPWWLYNDGDRSRVDYFQRLGKLMGYGSPISVRDMELFQ